MEHKFKTPEKLHKHYCQLFKDCFGQILSVKEIVKKAQKSKLSLAQSNNSKNSSKPITEKSFNAQYLHRLASMRMIIMIKLDLKNPRFKKDTIKDHIISYYKFKPSDNQTRRYFIFTPMTSRAFITFWRIIKNLSPYLNNKKELEKEFNANITDSLTWEMLGAKGQKLKDVSYLYKNEKIGKIAQLIKKDINIMKYVKDKFKENEK